LGGFAIICSFWVVAIIWFVLNDFAIIWFVLGSFRWFWLVLARFWLVLAFRILVLPPIQSILICNVNINFISFSILNNPTFMASIRMDNHQAIAWISILFNFPSLTFKKCKHEIRGFSCLPGQGRKEGTKTLSLWIIQGMRKKKYPPFNFFY